MLSQFFPLCVGNGLTKYLHEFSMLNNSYSNIRGLNIIIIHLCIAAHGNFGLVKFTA